MGYVRHRARMNLVSLVPSILVLILCCNVSSVSGDSDGYVERVKRQIGGSLGGEACVQIYSVPKQTVRCEPSTEVQDAIEVIRTALDQVVARVDVLDPDKPQELPEDVQQRLQDIEDMRLAQSGTTEALRKLESELAHVLERVKMAEAAESAEVAGLMATQARLIEATLHQTNASLHDEYVDRLHDTAVNISLRLQELELGLRKTLDNKEVDFRVAMTAAEERSRAEVEAFRLRMRETFADFEEKLLQEAATRAEHRNQTNDHGDLLGTLFERIDAILQHQARYEDHQVALREELLGLKEQIQREAEAKLMVQAATTKLRSDLDVLTRQYGSVMDQLRANANDTGSLREEFQEVREMVRRRDHLLPRTIRLFDCQEALKYFQPVSGVYPISPAPVLQPFDAYCDMDGPQGWTVIQRRMTGGVDFFRGWQEYRDGFGEVDGEHWLGLERIHIMTNKRQYQLKVDLQDWDGKWWHAVYDHFYLEDESNAYKLHVSGYHGDAGDSLSFHNEMPFSTMDKNHDVNNGICATWCHGAWWYKNCFHSNLNGRYYETGPYVTRTGWGDGVVWRHIQGTNFYSLKTVSMKIMPSSGDANKDEEVALPEDPSA